MREQIARKYIAEQQEYLTQEVAKNEPQIQKDRAEYGHIKRVYRNSPEHKEWLRLHQTEVPNPHVREGEKATWSYGAANPIILEDDIALQEKYNKQKRENIAFVANELHREKQHLESVIRARNQESFSFFKNLFNNKNKVDRVRIANIDRLLAEADNRLEAMPVYEAHTRLKQQDVRQERLRDLEKRHKYPTDYYLNNKEFVNQPKYYTISAPDGRHAASSQRWLEETTIPTIMDEDKSGIRGYYYGLRPSFDPDLTNLMYNKSDELLHKNMQGLTWGERDHAQSNWSKELTRLENKKRARAGQKPTKHTSWINAWDAKQKKEEAAEQKRRQEHNDHIMQEQRLNK